MNIDNAVFADGKHAHELSFQPNNLLNNLAAINKTLTDSYLKLEGLDTAPIPKCIDLELTLKESIRGLTKSLTIADQIKCTHCINFLPSNRLECSECKGLGYREEERQIKIEIPPGTLPGHKFVYKRSGAQYIHTNEQGDLIVKIKLAEHSDLKIQNNNITSKISISLYQAVLGGEVEIDTLSGKIIMTIKPLTQPGSIYKLSGLGIAGGDHLVTVEIEMPQTLTKEQVSLFQKIEKLDLAKI